MKRRIVAVILVCCLMTAIAAPAATADEVAPCAVLIQPMMSFKGTTVNCGLVVSEISTELEATIKLWQGNFCIKTWQAEGSGYIYFAEDTPILQLSERMVSQIWV